MVELTWLQLGTCGMYDVEVLATCQVCKSHVSAMCWPLVDYTLSSWLQGVRHVSATRWTCNGHVEATYSWWS